MINKGLADIYSSRLKWNKSWESHAKVDSFFSLISWKAMHTWDLILACNENHDLLLVVVSGVGNAGYASSTCDEESGK